MFANYYANTIVVTTSQASCNSCQSAALSCEDIGRYWPKSSSGYYNIVDNEGKRKSIYCHIEPELCGSRGGWTRLAYLNMSDDTQNCPSGFRLYQSGGVRACGRSGTNPSCVSAIFPSNGTTYSQICGRVIGYQSISTDAVSNYHNDIDSWYVEGVSITRGSPRQHVWTLMAGITELDASSLSCPCNAGSTVPVVPFIGNHYYCESGNNNTNWSTVLYTADPLWDGKKCGSLEAPCCTAPGLPWFHRDYGTNTTTDYIELRVCGDQGSNNEDSPVTFYEIYVK